MAKIDKVDLSGFSGAVNRIIDNYSKDVHDIVVETCELGIKESKKFIVKDLVSLSKNKKGDGSKRYRSSFTTRKKSDTSRILWNKQYQLSHLLEDGHFVYNQFGGPYNIHPEWPIIFKIKKNGEPAIYGSEYGTEGKVTIGFKSWDSTEKHTADYVEKTLMKKLK